MIDANQRTNGAGAGFASFYADSNKSYQKYPDIITAIRNASPQYNPDGHSNGDDTSGMMLWRAPATQRTLEVVLYGVLTTKVPPPPQWSLELL